MVLKGHLLVTPGKPLHVNSGLLRDGACLYHSITLKVVLKRLFVSDIREASACLFSSPRRYSLWS